MHSFEIPQPPSSLRSARPDRPIWWRTWTRSSRTRSSRAPSSGFASNRCATGAVLYERNSGKLVDARVEHEDRHDGGRGRAAGLGLPLRDAGSSAPAAIVDGTLARRSDRRRAAATRRSWSQDAGPAALFVEWADALAAGGHPPDRRPPRRRRQRVRRRRRRRRMGVGLPHARLRRAVGRAELQRERRAHRHHAPGRTLAKPARRRDRARRAISFEIVNQVVTRRAEARRRGSSSTRLPAAARLTVRGTRAGRRRSGHRARRRSTTRPRSSSRARGWRSPRAGITVRGGAWDIDDVAEPPARRGRAAARDAGSRCRCRRSAGTS